MGIISRVESPPPMRGIVQPNLIEVAPRRITPAHAGNSSLLEEIDKLYRDHPRPCGE